MKPRSSTLFHFTKSLEAVKNILKNGLYPRYVLEDVRWHNLDDDFIAWPMSCFCDIPLSRIIEHTNFYGHYGIGITKSFGMKNGLSPVIYTLEDGYMDSHLRSIFFLVNGLGDKEKEDMAIKIPWKILRHIKPIQGQMVVSGKVVEKEFYTENEWRYVIEDAPFMSRESYDDLDERARYNLAAEQYKLIITPSDIKYIFVNNDSDIPNLVNYIYNELDHYPSSDLKILNSRITSLESLNDDM